MDKTTAHGNEIRCTTGGTPTVHGLNRTMERMHMKRDQAVRLIQKAWTRGKSVSELRLSRLRCYLKERDRICEAGPTELRFYQGCLFIFSSAQGELITMYPVPRSRTHQPVYAGKERVRKIRQYLRMVPPSLDCYDYEDLSMLEGAC